mmetsp:Transcript_4637/g.6702  ORF Transcript_4637/g.6702 Transcript_4637/m.6702 type:complete len:778 (+) Transcript_4637:138-2471(+)
MMIRFFSLRRTLVAFQSPKKQLHRTISSSHPSSSGSKSATVAGALLIGTTIYLSEHSRDHDIVATKLEEQQKQQILPQRNTLLPTRNQQIQTLSCSHDHVFDVLIVGGGATGAGAALDATTRGLSTALIERGDFGNETSSRSTKLIWAGIRYIATATASLLRLKNITRPVDAVSDFWSEFQMVRQCHKERRLLLNNNPHLTHWVPIAVPLDSWITWPPPFDHPLFCIAPLVLPLVFKFYDGMSGFTCPPSHVMGKSRAFRKFPQLASEQAKYYSVFYEGSHNDARTATYIALTAAEHGACVTNYTEMVKVLYGANGQARGVKVKDHLSGKTFNVYAKSIIFAGGPFTDGLRKLEQKDCQPAVAAAAGTHIVLPGYYCAGGIGMLDINTSDGRFLFFLPWQGKTLVGTTDRKEPAVSNPGPPEDEIDWLLHEIKKYLAQNAGSSGQTKDGFEIRRTDVLSAWQGFRPLASDPNAPAGAPISRDHVISTNAETGITFITGGKWTTYREMAEDVLDRILQRDAQLKNKAGPCVTDTIPLRGGAGFGRNLPIQLVQQFGVSLDVAKHLAETYGTHAWDVLKSGKDVLKGGKLLIDGYPYLELEIEYACRNEMAVTLTDMLTQRTRLAYLDSNAAATVAPRVADLMAKSLGWSKKRKKEEVLRALEVANSFGGPIPKTQKQAIRSSRSMEDLFRSFDVNKSGCITYDELRLCMKHFGKPFKNEEEAFAAFKAIDKDRDGKIDFTEFMQWWKRLKRRQTRTMSDVYKLSSDKLGSGSPGAAFG